MSNSVSLHILRDLVGELLTNKCKKGVGIDSVLLGGDEEHERVTMTENEGQFLHLTFLEFTPLFCLLRNFAPL